MAQLAGARAPNLPSSFTHHMAVAICMHGMHDDRHAYIARKHLACDQLCSNGRYDEQIKLRQGYRTYYVPNSNEKKNI